MSSLLAVLFLIFPLACVAQTMLTVAAASDLTDVEPALAAGFRKIEPKVQVRFVTAASATLAQQIENGAPYDVFLSANAQFVDRLASNRSLLPESVRAYATGRIGVLWRDRKSHPFKDLAAKWVRVVALPNPKLAPYGVAAQQALEHSGIWQVVQPKVVYGENVRQTLQLFESGNADAVLTSDSLLRSEPADPIPGNLHNSIIQKAGIVARSSFRKNAEAFLSYLVSPPAQAVFARFGFAKP
ncbi:MAG: molybdate ABC transporter substrate-binding protein [Acidobacteriaceae bacterium]|nr:molybdate ABC transporter substrate-binding protein [Acidobacteriaceae bacterium]